MKTIKFESYRIALRINSVFHTISIPYIINRFGQVGYHTMIPPPTVNPLSEETNIGVRGPLLKNQNLTIDINSDTNSIGIQSNSLNDLLDNFDFFLTTVKDMLPENKHIWFYEFQSHVKFENEGGVTGKNKISGKIINQVLEFSNRIGIKPQVSSIGFWSEQNPDSEHFMEIKLQQDTLDNNLSVYKIIYRNPDEGVFKNSIQTLTDFELLSNILE